MAKSVILYVDDDREVLQSFKIGLEDRGYTMLTAESGDEALELLKTNTPDLIIADLRMQPMNGFDLYQIVKPPLTVPTVNCRRCSAAQAGKEPPPARSG